MVKCGVVEGESGRRYATWELGGDGPWVSLCFTHVYHRVVPLALRGRSRMQRALRGGSVLRLGFKGFLQGFWVDDF